MLSSCKSYLPQPLNRIYLVRALRIPRMKHLKCRQSASPSRQPKRQGWGSRMRRLPQLPFAVRVHLRAAKPARLQGWKTLRRHPRPNHASGAAARRGVHTLRRQPKWKRPRCSGAGRKHRPRRRRSYRAGNPAHRKAASPAHLRLQSVQTCRPSRPTKVSWTAVW